MIGRGKRWLGGMAFALVAVGVSACGAKDQGAELRALTERIEGIEAAQEQDRQLMARTLEASTNQLALVLATLRKDGGLGGPGRGDPVGMPPAETESPDTGQDGPTTPPSSEQLDDPVEGAVDPAPANADSESTQVQSTFGFDFLQAAVIFLAVSVVLLILVVVFFSGRLRGPPATAQFSAREDVPVPLPAQSPAPPTASMTPDATDTQRTPDVVVAPDSPDADEDDDSPIRHRIALPAGRPESLRSLVDALDTYLSTEPYILRHPEPRVALLKGELHLQFFALPSLSESEHALLDATVRRLQPLETGTSEGAPAA